MLDEKKIEEACDRIRAVFTALQPNRAEILNILSHSTLEAGIGVYRNEGGLWDSNDPLIMKRISVEQKKSPSIGKILILYSVVLREMYMMYLEKQYGVANAEEKSGPGRPESSNQEG